MKKEFYLILIIVLSSCIDFLDKQPLDKISEATFWKSPEDAIAGLNACYDPMQTFQNSNNMCYELMGILDCLTPIGNPRDAGMAIIANGNIDPTNNRIYQWWTSQFNGIVRCNDLLEHIEQIVFPANDTALKSRIIGEAKFLRALYYFLLVDYFGDVPLILKLQSIKESQVPRDSKNDIIKIMIDDLNDVIEKLPKQYNSSNLGRATSGAAKTLKLKYLLLLKDFRAAAVTAKEIIDGHDYKLQANFPDIFNHKNENNSEVIFDVQFISFIDDGSSFDKLFGNRSASGDGWSWIHPTLWLIDKYEKIDNNPQFTVADKRISNDIYNYFEGRDPRMDWTIVRPGAYFIDRNSNKILYPYQMINYGHSLTGMHLRKNVIEGPDGISYDSPNNWIIFRLADVILLFAEAKTQSAYQNNQIVSDPDIYNAVNQIRQRASSKLSQYKIGSLTKEQMLEKIYDERIRELAFEGWLTSDFKRWNLLDINNNMKIMGLTINNTSIKFATSPVTTRVFESKNNLWPIPQREIDVNPNLSQNSDY